MPPNRLVIPDRPMDPPGRTMPDSTQGIAKDILGPDTSTLKHIRKDPMLLYGIFVELARQIYSVDVAASVPGTWIWNEDKDKTAIWIDTEYRYNDDNPEQNPALFVSLQAIQYSSYTGQTKGLSSMDMAEGEYNYSRTAKGQVNFIHIGNTKGEGVLLASNTFNYLDAFADVIRQEFCFDKFFLIGFNPMQVVKEEREKFRSVVSASFEFQESFSVKLESPKLKALVIRAGQRAMDVLSF